MVETHKRRRFRGAALVSVKTTRPAADLSMCRASAAPVMRSDRICARARARESKLAETLVATPWAPGRFSDGNTRAAWTRVSFVCQYLLRACARRHEGHREQLMRRSLDLAWHLERVLTPCSLRRTARHFCEAAAPWFLGGLTFRCTGCAKCCHKPTQAGVLVNSAEKTAIAGHLNVTQQELERTCLVPGCEPPGVSKRAITAQKHKLHRNAARQSLQPVPALNLTSLTSCEHATQPHSHACRIVLHATLVRAPASSTLHHSPCACRTNQLATGDDGACVFLRSGRCSVHEVKPTPCATYPFWNRALWSPVDWNAEGTRCEGITPAVVRVQPACDEHQASVHLGNKKAAEPAGWGLERFSQLHGGASEAEERYSAEQVRPHGNCARLCMQPWSHFAASGRTALPASGGTYCSVMLCLPACWLCVSKPAHDSARYRRRRSELTPHHDVQIVKAMLMNDLHTDADETRDGLEGMLEESIDAEGLADTVASYAADCRHVVWADARLTVLDTALEDGSQAAVQRCALPAPAQPVCAACMRMQRSVAHCMSSLSASQRRSPVRVCCCAGLPIPTVL